MSVAPQGIPATPFDVRKHHRFPRLRRTLIVMVVMLFAVALLVPVGGYMYARPTLPQVKGQLRIPGLSAPVTVFRDDHGVPHIEANSAHDLFVAQGFVTAQDRLVLMDHMRRIISGRTGEIFGPISASTTDVFFRTFRLPEIAERSVESYSPATKQILEDYAAGINAYIDQAKSEGTLPLEFGRIGYEPEPWTPKDSVLLGILQAWTVNRTWIGQMWRYYIRQEFGDRLASQLLPYYPDDAPITIPRTTQAPAPQATGYSGTIESHVDLRGLMDVVYAVTPSPRQFVGSNAWVVSGAKTTTGKPMLAADPHLELSEPSLWYQIHLMQNGSGDKLNVIGVSMPGLPGVLLGHNESIAWGISNAGPDVHDIYLERRNPNNPHEFEYNGQWEKATVHDEIIKVKGAPDQHLEVVVTRHGPIISDMNRPFPDVKPHDAMSLKWVANDANVSIEGFLDIDRATNWTEFRAALKKVALPSVNFVFAATNGDIALRTAGLIPIRAKGTGLEPSPGWSSEYEWSGYIPFEEMPEIVNPPEGIIVNANNRLVDSSYPYHLANTWSPPYRATRILEVLRGKTGLTVDDMRVLQIDHLDLQARQVLPMLLPHAEKAQLSDQEREVLALMKAWDLIADANKPEPLIYYLWWRQFNQQVFQSRLGTFYRHFDDQMNVVTEMIRQASLGNENDWIREAGGFDKVALQSFRDAVQEAAQLQGTNPRKWTWGEFHWAGPDHPLASTDFLKWLLNVKRAPVSGSENTVGAAPYELAQQKVAFGSAWRTVVDLGNIANNSYDMNYPGQSAHFLSPWYQDQRKAFLGGTLYKQLSDPRDYRRGQTLVLHP